MNKTYFKNLLLVMAACMIGTGAAAATVIEGFEIEGLISPASPKALTEALEEQLDVKVVGLNLKDTATGWPGPARCCRPRSTVTPLDAPE